MRDRYLPHPSQGLGCVRVTLRLASTGITSHLRRSAAIVFFSFSNDPSGKFSIFTSRAGSGESSTSSSVARSSSMISSCRRSNSPVLIWAELEATAGAPNAGPRGIFETAEAKKLLVFSRKDLGRACGTDVKMYSLSFQACEG